MASSPLRLLALSNLAVNAVREGDVMADEGGAQLLYLTLKADTWLRSSGLLGECPNPARLLPLHLHRVRQQCTSACGDARRTASLRAELARLKSLEEEFDLGIMSALRAARTRRRAVELCRAFHLSLKEGLEAWVLARQSLRARRAEAAMEVERGGSSQAAAAEASLKVNAADAAAQHAAGPSDAARGASSARKRKRSLSSTPELATAAVGGRTPLDTDAAAAAIDTDAARPNTPPAAEVRAPQADPAAAPPAKPAAASRGSHAGTTAPRGPKTCGGARESGGVRVRAHSSLRPAGFSATNP